MESSIHFDTKRFLVALSFAGEYRSFVEGVAEQLSIIIGKDRVFYDHYYKAELARPNLDIYLSRIYREDAGLLAIFLCSNYAQKQWCGLEWRVVRDLIKTRDDSEIIPLKFDNVKIEGMLSIDGYIEIGNMKPDEVACLILQRINGKDSICLHSSQGKLSVSSDEIEIILDTNLEDFTLEREQRFLRVLSLLLQDSEVRIRRKRPGNSIILTLDLTSQQWGILKRAIESGALAEFKPKDLLVNGTSVLDSQPVLTTSPSPSASTTVVDEVLEAGVMSEYRAFVVAFGYGVNAPAQMPAQTMAAGLRDLIDKACAATFGSFPSNVLVSVVPGGVMLAFPDTNPERAVQLCEAVAKQLTDQGTRGRKLLPVCAALTHGTIRTFDMLGFSTSFEGLPAIVGARIVAKLPTGTLAVESSRVLGGFTTLTRHLDAAQTLLGKHAGETFEVRLHQRIRFPTTPTTAVSPPEPPQATPVPALAPYLEFADTVRQRIADLLQEPHMQSVREALRQQAGNQDPVEALVPQQPERQMLREALARLYRAAQSCLPRVMLQSPVHRQDIKRGIEALFGWQVLLVVNRDHLQEGRLVFDPWQNGLRKQLPLTMEASVEVLVSTLGYRDAGFVLKYDTAQHRTWAVGKGGLRAADLLETGIAYADQLLAILQRIWSAVMTPEILPVPFDETYAIPRLRARLEGEELRQRSYYYVTVPTLSASSPFADTTLLAQLHAVLPSLRIMYLQAEQEQGLLLVSEHQLADAIEALLSLLDTLS